MRTFKDDIDSLEELNLLTDNVLNELKHKYAKEFASKISNHLRKWANDIEKYSTDKDKIKSLEECLDYSPSGDGYGCNNNFINFGFVLFGKDYKESCDIGDALRYIYNILDYNPEEDYE